MSTRQFTKIVAATAGAVSLAVTLAACGSSGGSSKGANGGSNSGSSGGGVVAQSGSGARLTGVYAASQLDSFIPQNMYPSDITDVSSGDYTTGNTVAAKDKYSWPSLSCTGVVEDLNGPGFGEVAFEIYSGENSKTSDFYGYGFYEFKTAAEAKQFVDQAAAKVASCGSFQMQESNGALLPIRFSFGSSAASVPSADDAVELIETLSPNGKTVTGSTVFAADGNIVVQVSSAGALSVPTEANNAQIAEKILKALTAGEAANPTPAAYSTDTASPTPPSSQLYQSQDSDRVRVYSTDAVRVGGGLR